MTRAAMPCETILRQRKAGERGTHEKYVAISGREVQLFDLGWQHVSERQGSDLRSVWEVVTHDLFNLENGQIGGN